MDSHFEFNNRRLIKYYCNTNLMFMSSKLPIICLMNHMKTKEQSHLINHMDVFKISRERKIVTKD